MTARLVQLTRRMSKLHASPYFELSMQLMVGIELPMLPMPHRQHRQHRQLNVERGIFMYVSWCLSTTLTLVPPA